MHKLFLLITFLSIAIVIIFTAQRFMFEKNYTFILEAPCDSTTERCFHRDCSTENECPPNLLENYKKYNIQASDFQNCSDNSCIKECMSNAIVCEETVCDSTLGDNCSVI